MPENSGSKWDHYFLRLAKEAASMSKDPSTKVGAVIVDQDRNVVATGFNGFPRGLSDDKLDYEDREIKLGRIVHAETNAILSAAQRGVSTKDCSLYVWPFPPCMPCALNIIQAGISKVFHPPFSTAPDRWLKSTVLAADAMASTDIRILEINHEQ
jgi:dCMP deaminase